MLSKLRLKNMAMMVAAIVLGMMYLLVCWTLSLKDMSEFNEWAVLIFAFQMSGVMLMAVTLWVLPVMKNYIKNEVERQLTEEE